MNQDYQRTVQEVSSNARSLNREMGHVAEHIAEAQVAAARAMFNMSNACFFGSLTPVVAKFEEGLNLYQRTVHDLQDSRDRVAETMIHQAQEGQQSQQSQRGDGPERQRQGQHA